jgi:hypothetical protein
MSADEESSSARYEALYRFAKETAAKGNSLPDWKKPETGAVVRESSPVVANSAKTTVPSD